MKRSAILAVLGLLSAFLVFGAIRWSSTRLLPNQKDAEGRLTWPNGWRLSPAGRIIDLAGDMPVNIATTSDGRWAIVQTAGYHGHSLEVVDLAAEKIAQVMNLGRAGLGLALDEKGGVVYVAGGNVKPKAKRPDHIKDADELPDADEGAILRLKFAGGRLEPMTPLAIPEDAKDVYVTGLALLKNGAFYALNTQSDTLYRFSREGQVEASGKVGYRPYAMAQSPNGTTVAVSDWGGGAVSLVKPEDLSVKATIQVGSQPCALVYSSDGRLFVANTGSNSVSVIQGDRVVETIRTSLDAKDPIGSSPNALAIDEKHKLLLVTNGDNNDVAVVNIARPGSSNVAGFVPTGRYPSAIAVTCDQGRVLIATGKGLTSGSNVTPEQRAAKTATDGENRVPYTYVGNMLQGNLAFVDLPDPAKLAEYTSEVLKNRPLGEQALPSSDKAAALAAFHKIKHVIYVIRENRTYDQVLGDVPNGNGDADLTMFGQTCTPNSHRLAHDFVLLDNLYCDGEVSQVGHQWTGAAYATDYCEKEWTQSYSGRGEIVSDTRLTSSPAGYLWDDAKKHGRTARIFGEYVAWQEDHGPAEGEVKKDPERFGCSAEFEKIFARGGRDTEKVDEFLGEMRLAEQGGQWPNLMVMALPEDHTSGARPGKHTPGACVANNDLALGKLVEGVSHSKFWPETAIFVIQDDAQAGCDHVDCHRTVGHAISPYTRRGTVDSTMYTTSSMIRTMELILGLPPMSQYDAAATPMYASFTDKADLSAFDGLPATVDVEAMNPVRGELARRSILLDLSDIDRADPKEFNAILWACMKPGKPEPAPVHGVRLR